MPLPSPGADGASVRRARPLLGTRVEIAVSDGRCSEQDLHAAVSHAFAEVERVHRLMSLHDPDSELSELNRVACRGPLRVHSDTFKVLQMALKFAALSGGAFDPTVAPILERWGYLPDSKLQYDHGADWRDIELNDENCVLYRRRLRVDLGGIAKGYAVDLAVAALQAREIEEVTVNAGGDLRVAGPSSRRVRLRHPLRPTDGAHFLQIREQALATSAPYFSRRHEPGGREVSALLHPRDRMPELHDCSVSVRANDCASADALTKVVLFAPREVAERSLELCGAEACMLR